MELTLYSRSYCHLCDEMLEALLALRDDLGGEALFSVQVVDVDADPKLVDRYDELVPVLIAGDDLLCYHFLDADAVRAYLAEIR